MQFFVSFLPRFNEARVSTRSMRGESGVVEEDMVDSGLMVSTFKIYIYIK
jgi:hypothetical protein